jgi:hypothetical protein
MMNGDVVTDGWKSEEVKSALDRRANVQPLETTRRCSKNWELFATTI